MPTNELFSSPSGRTANFRMRVQIYGPIKLSEDFPRQAERVIKARNDSGEFFTEISLVSDRHSDTIVVEYHVHAKTPDSARRVGTVYLSQLCDLLTACTQCPLQFFMDESQAREERGRNFRQPMQINRILSHDEWLWVTGSLVALREQHPRYLAAASWYRKGLIGNDVLDDFCCYWRVIERLADSYADKSTWEKGEGGVRKTVAQLTKDLFTSEYAPALLRDDERVKRVVKLRNDISHGNEPITIDMIENANQELSALEQAAFSVLEQMRKAKLEINI
jgi:hypothetical protein